MSTTALSWPPRSRSTRPTGYPAPRWPRSRIWPTSTLRPPSWDRGLPQARSRRAHPRDRRARGNRRRGRARARARRGGGRGRPGRRRRRGGGRGGRRRPRDEDEPTEEVSGILEVAAAALRVHPHARARGAPRRHIHLRVADPPLRAALRRRGRRAGTGAAPRRAPPSARARGPGQRRGAAGGRAPGIRLASPGAAGGPDPPGRRSRRRARPRGRPAGAAGARPAGAGAVGSAVGPHDAAALGGAGARPGRGDQVIVLLIDERPEEATAWREAVSDAQFAVATAEIAPRDQVRVADLALERARRIAETGGDAALVVDSLSRLAYADGDVGAVKRLFGSGRNLAGRRLADRRRDDPRRCRRRGGGRARGDHDRERARRARPRARRRGRAPGGRPRRVPRVQRGGPAHARGARRGAQAALAARRPRRARGRGSPARADRGHALERRAAGRDLVGLEAADPPVPALGLDALVLSERVAAEAVAHHARSRAAQLLRGRASANSCITDCAITGIGTSMCIASSTSQFTSPVSSTNDGISVEAAALAVLRRAIRSISHERITEPWRQQREHAGDVERVAVALEQVDAFADRLQHAELDAVVDELREVARARAARRGRSRPSPRARCRIGSRRATGVAARRRP